MTTHNLYIRPARPDDRAAVVAMVATVWGGDDYVPDVWDEWISDASGPLLVGVLDEQPVAVAKLTALSPGEDWFEGLRVNLAVRGRGYARAMLRRCIELSRARAARTLRFITDEDNVTMHRAGEELGFALRYSPAQFVGKPRAGAPPLLVRLPVAHLLQLRAALDRSPLMQFTGGLYSYSWSAYELTDERLRAHLERGQVVTLAEGAAWAIVVPDEWFGYWLAHAEGDNAELERLFTALRGLPMDGERAGVWAQFHPDAPCIGALLAAGYTRDGGERLYELAFRA